MKVRAIAIFPGALVLAGTLSAAAIVASTGGLRGGTSSTSPGIGGHGMPGQVPGGTLSTQPGVGGAGVPGEVPGGTLAPIPLCGGGPCTRVLVMPGLVVPVPATSGTLSGGAAAPILAPAE